MFQIIRAGLKYDPVVVVTPPGSGPNTPGAKYYIRRSWKVAEQAPDVFHEISSLAAQMAFSGHADGWGFADDIPDKTFESLEELNIFINEK